MESLRVGIRVPDVEQARTFYCGLGFEEVGTIPGPDGPPVLAILHWRGAHLILEALDGMPFQNSTREHQIQEGPRGLGVAIGMSVDDLASVYEYCQTHGCVITAEPNDEPYGDRVFECFDPYGYLWEFSMPIAEQDPERAVAETSNEWFGNQR